MEKLQPFSPSELQLMISGEQVPQWTKEDVLSYTEPKYGFTRDSPVYQRFVNVLAEMSGEEKKVGTFLSFLENCERHDLFEGVFGCLWAPPYDDLVFGNGARRKI